MDSELSEAKDQREARRYRRAKPALSVIELAEDVCHYAIILVLLGVAIVVLGITVHDLVMTDESAAVRVDATINGVLFVVIVMELLRTVVAHFETSDFQLRPFLIIGVISAVRHILIVGAHLTLVGEGDSHAFAHAQVELGINSGIVLALGLALVLVGRTSEVSPGHR